MSKSDINDLLRDGGVDAVRAAFTNARRVIHAHGTPSKSVRDGRAVELLRPIVAVKDPMSPLFVRGHLVYERSAVSDAARLIPALAAKLQLSNLLVKGGWTQHSEKLATKLGACGTGFGVSEDAKHDRVTWARPCHVPGCHCGVGRIRWRVTDSLSRLAALPAFATYAILHVICPIGAGPRTRMHALQHGELLIQGQQRFADLREASSIAGFIAMQRTEARYGLWDACVGAIVVARDVDAVRKQLAGWYVGHLGTLTDASRIRLAAWRATFAAWRLAPEMGKEDRAQCLLDEYLTPRRGSLIGGVLHGNALKSLEARVASEEPAPVVAADQADDDDGAYSVPSHCICGERLKHRGRCNTESIGRDGWTPRKRHWIAGPNGCKATGRWMTRKEAENAVARRRTIEAKAAASDDSGEQVPDDVTDELGPDDPNLN